ncbi:hypothetical protein EMGBD3_02500 [Nitrosarchaeum sp.]|nr:hypothetical protein EMGBD3_02500 [Nitrosarchaeum sp.]
MSEQGTKKSGGLSRRDFLKLMGAAGTGLAFAPFCPHLEILCQILHRQFLIKLKSFYLMALKQCQNISCKSSEVITYPSTGDPALDAEAFRKWQFIRLPSELGGDKEDVSSFRAYSMVCLHLWCLWKYWPEEGRKRGECPCHGSMYDPTTGTAFAGPASLQAAPSNT